MDRGGGEVPSTEGVLVHGEKKRSYRNLLEKVSSPV
jgi:hypothetical protein